LAAVHGTAGAGRSIAMTHAATNRLIPHGAAERWQLRGQMQHETQRLALAVWWGRYTEDDARRELRTMTAAAAECGRYQVKCGLLARELLDEAIDALERKYEQSVASMKAAALDALERGHPRAAAAMQACSVAATADPQPPAHLVRFAIDGACRLHQWRLKHAGERVVA
jgi:hypothetical protein